MKQSNTKVGIIGGGLAGIYTAYLLQQQGIPYQLLEAKPLLGGRIYGEATLSDDYKIDLGPSWIFPHQYKIQKLTKTLGLTLLEQFTQGDAIFQRHSHENPHQIKGVPPPVMYRIAGGTTVLVETLAAKLLRPCVALGRTVSKLQFDGERWAVSSHGDEEENLSSLQFEHLVIAMPPRIAASKLSLTAAYADKLFEYAYSSEHKAGMLKIQQANRSTVTKSNALLLQDLLKKFAQTSTWMAAQAKFAVTYDRPFWRKRGLSGQAFSHVGPMIEIHDASYEDPSRTSVYALFGFIGIPYSQRQQITADAMKNACLSQLSILFGKDASEYQHTYIKDWGNDPFIASTQDQTQASAHPQIELTSEQAWLSQIKLHLAASEFAQNEAGYMEGAIIAAENAVEQIVLAGA